MMLFSCAKEESTPVQQEGYTYTFAISNASTKLTLNDEATAFAWTNGDNVNVYSGSQAVQGTISASGSDASVSATFDTELKDGAQVYGTFPYLASNSSTSAVVFSIPTSQSSAALTDAMPMYSEALEVEAGTEASGTLQMHNLGAVLKFKVYGASHTEETVTSISYAAEGIAGNFASVDITNSPALAEGDADAVTATASSVAVGSSADDAGLVYMVVAPAAASTTGTITVVTSAATYTATLPSALSLNANDLVTVPLNLDNSLFTSTSNYDFTSVSELKSLSASDEAEYTGTFTDAIVTGVYSPYAYIQDANAGVMVYGASVVKSLAAGQKISGEITCKVKTYNGNVEITSLVTSSATVETGATVPETTLTISELNTNFDSYDAMRVKVVSADVTQTLSSSNRSGKIEQDGNSVIAYVQISSGVEGANAGENIDVVGYPGYYSKNNSTTNEFMVYSDDDITKNTILPDITVSPETLTQNVGDDDVTLSVTTESTGKISYESSDEAVVTVTSAGVVTFVAKGTATITVTVAADGKYLANSATCTVTVYAEGEEIPTSSTATFDFSSLFKSTSTFSSNATVATSEPITIIANNAKVASNKSGQLRLYAGSSTEAGGEIIISGGTITNIAFTFSGSNTGSLGADSGTYSDGTWTGSASSVTITNNGTSQARITKMVVTYTASSSN